MEAFLILGVNKVLSPPERQFLFEPNIGWPYATIAFCANFHTPMEFDTHFFDPMIPNIFSFFSYREFEIYIVFVDQAQVQSQRQTTPAKMIPDEIERNITAVNIFERTTQQAQTAPNQPMHSSQRSYDIVSPIQLREELGELPPGWEQTRTPEGQVYYLE